MTTFAYTAKAALFDYLTTLTGVGQPLEGIQVSYAFPGNPEHICIYGGGIRFEQRDVVEESPGVMVSEETLVSVYIRVSVTPPTDVRDTDEQCAAIGAAFGAILRQNPKLIGGNGVVGIARGTADYTQTDDETISILAYQVRCITHLTYGSP